MRTDETMRTQVLTQRLSEAQATIDALLSDQIDAVVDPASQTPVLLGNAQRALRESEERYRRIVETANEGISIVDAEARFTFVNPRFAAMLGYGVDELIGQSLAGLVTEEGDAVTALRIVLSRRGVSEEYQVPYLRKDGSTLWTLLKTCPIRTADGAWAGTLGMTTDWTRHRQDEEALRAGTAELVESEARFRQLAQASRDVIFLRDPQTTKMFYVSPAYEAIFGRTCESLYASPGSWGAAIHPDDQERMRDEVRLRGDLAAFDLEYRIVRPDGGERFIRSRGFPVYDAAGAVYRFAGIAEDITERKGLEAQIRQAQKMEGIGRLAAGVAHDFNNLLTAILGFAEMTLDQLREDDPARDDVQQIVSAGESAACLTRQLLAFSRQQVIDPQVLDVNAQLAGMETLLRRVIGEDVTLVTDLPARVPRIRADQGQIEQIAMNLAVNARDAMPAGGTLRITSEAVDLGLAFVAAHPGAVMGPHVRLMFSDTGTGMGPDVLARLFEPFFTTKGPGKGTGLGLATVYGIVKQSNGYIWVESTVGEGTSFMVVFPSVSSERAVAIPKRVHAGPRAGTETILVVEDQKEMRDVVRLTLQRQGYDVLEAADGAAALALLEARQDPVHLLLTDVIMPAISGAELFDRVSHQDPCVRVLYMSGYTDEALVRHGVLHPGIDLVHKPFTPRELLARVRNALDR